MWTSTDCISLQSVSHFLNQQNCSIFSQTSNSFHPYFGCQLKAHNLIPPTAMAQAGVQIWMFWALQGADAHQEHVSECDINPFTHMHIATESRHLFTQTFSDRKLKTLLSPLVSPTIMKMLTFKSAFYYIWFHLSCEITGWDANQCAVCCQMACWKGTNLFHTECYVAWECCSYTSK